jgi:hypothetical protein
MHVAGAEGISNQSRKLPALPILSYAVLALYSPGTFRFGSATHEKYIYMILLENT